MDVAHGTPEGFRLHKRLEHEPCPACAAAMANLLAGVRNYRDAVRGTMPALPPLPPFSQQQRAWWPHLRARERQPLPPIPAPSLPAVRCVGDEHFLPRSATTVAKKARAAGWWVQITRAIGPRIDAKGHVPEGREQVGTIAVAVARGDDRLVWTWEYVQKMKNGVLGWAWQLDDVYWSKKGTINDPEGKKVLNAEAR